MASTGDPWRILGLTPGASADEVRRAYRRLAKINHPDAAGEAALPRFLAIQAAYEQIAGPRRARRIGGRPDGAARHDPPAEPWRADPDRARASGRADGRRPGARPKGAAGSGGAADGGSNRDPGADAGSSSSDRPRTGPSGRARRSSKRQPKTAGPYSTSYDAADEEPFEPGWSGATWYGASSGTYWTINPKEYADPRKHGPEYQARARRARGAGGWIVDDEAVPPEDAAAPDSGTPPDPPPSAEPAAAAATDPARARRPDPGPIGPRPSAWGAASQDDGRTHDTGRPPGDRPPGPPPAAAAREATPAGFRPPVLPAPRTAGGRGAIAVLGWPPLALFAATAIGESTGCGRYAASCGEASSPGTWILSLAILVLLIAAPAVARWSAHGTLAMVLVGVPGAVVLSAAGGTNLREASAPILLGVLAVAYLAGVAYGLAAPRLGSGPESGSFGSVR